jgi:glycosyltransferase involved in cell wall biosynthesis
MTALDCSWLICSNAFDDRFVAAIASCLAQDAGATEVVVVCNGPGSAEISNQVRRAFAHAPSVLVLETPIVQLVFSLNLGVHHARGRFVARMDADDLAYPARLGAQLEHMERHPDVAVCGTDYDLIDDADRAIGRVCLPRDDAQIRARLTWTNPFCHPTTMLRRSAIVAAGGYLGGLYAEDYDLWVRLSRVPGLRFANLPFAGIGYRATPQGLARRARAAYASVAGTQFRCFANGFGWRWGAAAAATALKGCLRGSRQPA